MSAHLFVYPESAPPVGTDFTTTTVLDSLPDAAREQIAAVSTACAPDDVLVFWDMRLAPIPLDLLAAFARSGHDVWHPGNLTAPTDDPDLLPYVIPADTYSGGRRTGVEGAVNFRISLRAAFVRARVIQTLGGLDTGFRTLTGAALEMGYRWHMRGAVSRQRPAMLPNPPDDSVAPPLVDRYHLLALHHDRLWRRMAAVMRIMRGGSLSEWGLAGASWASGITPARIGALGRDLSAVPFPADARVSVVLPTYGRYKYVDEVLQDLRAQTIRPVQIIIADGNPEAYREPDVYARYPDLPLEVLYLTPAQTGTCAARNACLERITGDYVWFVDDDSRFEPENLENHLRLLQVYDADVSVGPAWTRDRPDLHGYQAEIRPTFMDCGTTVCRTAIIEAAGGFDMQYNDYLAGEDGDIGDRFLQAGGVMLNNPHARRFHYLAPVGGARSSRNNVHRWRRWALTPRPVQSVYYKAARHTDPASALRATCISWLQIGWRRRDGQIATRRWRLETAAKEALALPVSLYRLWRSIHIARAMLAAGARIPQVHRRAAAGADALTTKDRLHG